MVKRNIIKIDDELCTGCGECIPNCPEGAIQIIDDKARIISDIFCDGLGTCLGHCPVDAITIEEREAEDYDERKVMENVIKQGANVIQAHLEHLRDHDQTEYLQQALEVLQEKGMENPLEAASDKESVTRPEKRPTTSVTPNLACGCPGSAVQDLRGEKECTGSSAAPKHTSELRQWPVQLMLVPPQAPFLKDADLLIAADCVPCAHPNFHNELLKGKILLLGCPKFDKVDFYQEKLVEIFKNCNINSITVAIMEVPCCEGLYQLVAASLKEASVDIPLKNLVVGVKDGEIL